MPKNSRNKNDDKSSKKNKRSNQAVHFIPSRVNLLFFVIFVLFMILIGRLFQMQILDKTFYANKLVEGTGGNTQIVQGAPRGNIYDAKGKPLATTTPVEAIEYTRGANATASEMRKVADNLAKLLPSTIATGNLTERDKKDYYLADQNNLKKIADALTKKERTDKDGNDLPGGEIYKVELEKVTAEDINYTPEQIFAAKLFKEMNSTTNFNTTTIATGDITPEQQAVIAERESSLPGITVGTTWSRDYAQNSLTDILGTVTTQKQGLPSNLLDDYLKKGYQRNDRVGTALLEKGYEEYLQGTHNISQLEVDNNGNVKGAKVVQEGKKGDDLKLTVDLDFQAGVDNILNDEMAKMINEGFGNYATGAYAVVMDNKTGAILALSGLDRDPATGKMTKDSLGTFTKVYIPGSTVKPATISAAWKAGVISGNAILNDQPIQFLGTPTISSWFTNGGVLPISAVQALEYSSNTYMVQLALKMMGQSYTPNMTVSDNNRAKVYNELRQMYASYGLGTATGFDIPGETPGLLTSVDDASKAGVGQLLYESFGQFDSYTPLQMAVYASTLANNGKRIAPHIVEGVYNSNSDGSLGKEVKKIEAKVMNNVDVTASDMEILHEGMYRVVNGGTSMTTGSEMSKNVPVSISAKTGTSEDNAVAADGTLVPVTVNNVVAFAPSDNPQVSIGVMVPKTTIKDGGTTSEIGQFIVNDIVNLYNKMYHFK